MSKGITGVISEVRRSSSELCLQWRIPQFLDLPGEGFNYYNSPRFCFSGALWHLEVFPNWESSGQVSLYLWRDEDRGHSARTMNVAVGVKGSGAAVKWRIVRKWEMKNDAGLWLGVLCKKSHLKEHKRSLLRMGILSITCVVKIPSITDREVTNDDEVGDSEDAISICEISEMMIYECSKNESNEDKADGSASKKRMKSKNENADKRQQPSDECNICCEAPVDCALNPCGHMCWCHQCALRFWEEESPRCPICRTSIQTILKIYRQ